MIPYLHILFQEQERSGALVLCPYFMEDSSENTHQVEDPFLVGRHLLVAPVMQENCLHRKVRTYLCCEPLRKSARMRWIGWIWNT